MHRQCCLCAMQNTRACTGGESYMHIEAMLHKLHVTSSSILKRAVKAHMLLYTCELLFMLSMASAKSMFPFFECTLQTNVLLELATQRTGQTTELSCTMHMRLERICTESFRAWALSVCFMWPS